MYCHWTTSVVIDLKFHLICHMLAKFSGFNPKGPYPTLEKEKETICVVFTYSVKRARKIRKFHVAVVQRQLRNVQKKREETCKVVVFLTKPIGFCFFFCFCFVLLLFFLSFFFFFFFFFCRSRYCRRSCCLISALLLSRNLATMVTWRHTSPLYWNVNKKESPPS